MVFVFSTSSLLGFAFFAALLFIGSSLVCVCLEASNLDINFSLVFHHNCSKLEASNASSFMVFHYSTSTQATQTQCNWSVPSHGFKSVVWLWT